jgi:putative hydrolase of the HAD superfamily
MIDVIAFDGDDTLWHNELHFSVTQRRYREVMADYLAEADIDIDERLFQTEMGNLGHYGYGAKSFTLSMIETAIDVSGGRVTSAEVAEILALGKMLLTHPVDLLDGAAEAVATAVGHGRRLLLVTKGDLFHQESKLARSGLGELFDGVEIVAEKDEGTYRRVLDRHDCPPERFVMVGNSVRSDVLPVLGLGGWAVHVPFEIEWAHEHVDDSDELLGHPRFRRIDDLAGLADVLGELDDNA